MSAVDDVTPVAKRALPETTRAFKATAPDRWDIARKLRGVLTFTALLDLAVMGLSVLVAWNLRAIIDGWGLPPAGYIELPLRVAPYLVLLWFLILAGQGGYSLRRFGAGPEEFRAVGSPLSSLRAWSSWAAT